MRGYSPLKITRILKYSHDGRSFTDNSLFLKASITVLFCIVTFQLASLLEPVATFIVLDTILSVYLTSLFRSKYRYLFLIHPVFVLLSCYGFKIPYTEIGVGFTYLRTYDKFVDTSSLQWDIKALIEQLFFQGKTIFGFGRVYIGSIPIIWLPSFLFSAPPDIAIYLSLSVFTMLYTSVAVSVSLFFRVFRKDVLLIIALYATVSPTFLEINSTLHRYGLLLFGLFLFLISYVGLKRKSSLSRFSLLLIFMLSIIFIGVSKAPLFLSLFLFVFLDLLSSNKLPFVSKLLLRLKKWSWIMIVLPGVVLGQYVTSYIAPEKYVTIISQKGGSYQYLADVPVLGLILRAVYAILSPFPWVNFSQWQLYGYNSLFLWVHILSSLLAAWIILSIIARAPLILKGSDDIRVCVVFGTALIASLAFSAIGHHVYLAPSLPFLAVMLLDKSYRIPFIYPMGFCIFFEAIAQTMRST